MRALQTLVSSLHFLSFCTLPSQHLRANTSCKEMSFIFLMYSKMNSAGWGMEAAPLQLKASTHEHSAGCLDTAPPPHTHTPLLFLYSLFSGIRVAACGFVYTLVEMEVMPTHCKFVCWLLYYFVYCKPTCYIQESLHNSIQTKTKVVHTNTSLPHWASKFKACHTSSL